jgi:UDP-2,3-diacylglucosamine pyrophosphatase LpxH
MIILFISDLHLGCKYTNIDLIKRFFNKIPKHQKIVLVGDILDLWKTNDFEIYKELLIHRDIIYIKGNHDFNLNNIKYINEMNTIDIKDELIIETNNKRILIIHGHQVDKKYGNIDDEENIKYKDGIINKISDFLCINLRKHMYELIKIYYKYISNYDKKIAEFAKSKECNIVIHGHTHIPFHEIIDGVEIFNLSSWYNTPFILELNEGKYYYGKVEEFLKENSNKNYKSFR